MSCKTDDSQDTFSIPKSVRKGQLGPRGYAPEDFWPKAPSSGMVGGFEGASKEAKPPSRLAGLERRAVRSFLVGVMAIEVVRVWM